MYPTQQQWPSQGGYQPQQHPQQPPQPPQPQASSWDIGGDGGNSFPFDQVGDSVTGQIRSLTEQQQTDLQTGDPKTFSNGQPMMMYRVTLATQLRDPQNPSDSGERDVYLKGSRKQGCQSSLAAVLDAVRAATGGTQLEPGATLTLQYVGDGQATQRGFNAPKLYQASYQRPAMDLGGGAPQQQAPAQQYQPPMPQQPAYQPQPQQAPPAVQQPATMPPPQTQQQYAQQPIQEPAPPAPAAPAGVDQAKIAALQAAGINPADVIPGWTPQG